MHNHGGGLERKTTLNESPSEKEGKYDSKCCKVLGVGPSMKVPPKRKGNQDPQPSHTQPDPPLNESPSEKEGK